MEVRTDVSDDGIGKVGHQTILMWSSNKTEQPAVTTDPNKIRISKAESTCYDTNL